MKQSLINLPVRAVRFALDNSLLLMVGAVAGLVCANLTPDGYSALKSLPLFSASWLDEGGAGWQGVDLQFLVNDVLMAFFFGLAGKEVWAAMLPGGSLRDSRQAGLPILCAVGGMAGPALIYLAASALSAEWSTLQRGWAIPCATDVAFSYLVARLVFGRGHPAVPFLLLLAIADDALGLIVLAIFYPTHPMKPLWLLLMAAGVLLAMALRRGRVQNFWAYLAGPGVLSWFGLALAGIHPALALLPIIPILPHARTGQAPHWEIPREQDALDRFEAWWKRPVETILGLFGLFNAGVSLTAGGAPTWLVGGALVAGKPVGIFLTGLLAVRLFGLRLAQGNGRRELFVIGCAAGIGFTVALFVATVAFPAGPTQDAAKMGALASCAAVAVTLIAARLLHVGRWAPRKRGTTDRH